MKKLLIGLLISSILAPLVAQNQILPLWKGDPPNYMETGEVTIWDTTDIVRVRNVQKPDIAVFLPFLVALHLVTGLKAVADQQAGRQAQGHGSFVGPFPRLQVERASPVHTGNRLESTAGFELGWGAHGITRGEAEQAAVKSIGESIIRWHFTCPCLASCKT